MEVKVWERGSGITLACGTGACACVVAAIKLGLCDQNVLVSLPGGMLDIYWENNNANVILSGLAQSVYTGKFQISDFYKNETK